MIQVLSTNLLGPLINMQMPRKIQIHAHLPKLLYKPTKPHLIIITSLEMFVGITTIDGIVGEYYHVVVLLDVGRDALV
jgi:hypothetical protein